MLTGITVPDVLLVNMSMPHLASEKIDVKQTMHGIIVWWSAKTPTARCAL